MSGHNPEGPPPESVPPLTAMPPTAAESFKAFGQAVEQAHLRLSAALWALMFGDPAQRELVGRLVDGKLGEDEAQQVREGLDRVARKITGSR